MEITDFQVGIPYFIGSLRLAIGTIAKYQHLNTSNVIDSVELTYSGKAVDVSMQLKVNTDLHGYSNWLMSNKLLPQGIVNIEMTFCVGTTLSALTSRSMATLNKEHRQVGNYTLLRAFPQKLVDVMEEAYLPTDRIHISVEDLQMNKVSFIQLSFECVVC